VLLRKSGARSGAASVAVPEYALFKFATAHGPGLKEIEEAAEVEAEMEVEEAEVEFEEKEEAAEVEAEMDEEEAEVEAEMDEEEGSYGSYGSGAAEMELETEDEIAEAELGQEILSLSQIHDLIEDKMSEEDNANWEMAEPVQLGAFEAAIDEEVVEAEMDEEETEAEMDEEEVEAEMDEEEAEAELGG